MITRMGIFRGHLLEKHAEGWKPEAEVERYYMTGRRYGGTCLPGIPRW